MRTFILLARFIQGILGANWKQKITSSIAIVILAVISLKLSFPSIWQVWAWTWYFWFTLITLLIAVLAFQNGRKSRGYILLLVALTPSFIFTIKELRGSNSKTESQGTTRNAQHEPRYIEFDHMYRGILLEPYQRFEIIADPNTQFEVIGVGESGQKLTQTITFDLDGISTWTFSPKTDSLFQPQTKMVVKQTKGGGQTTIKVFY